MSVVNARDFLGNVFNVGDTVLIIEPGYRNMVKAKVIRLTDKMAFLTYNRGQGYESEIKQFHYQVVCINKITGE